MYVVLSLILGEPMLCILVCWMPPLILIPRKVFNKIVEHRIAGWICLMWICIPLLFGILSAIIDINRYWFTHERLMFTILGINMKFV